MSRAACAGAALALLAGLGGAAHAQGHPAPLWELGLGAGTLRLPHYRGADQSHTLLLPVPFVVYRGAIFKADREGARAVLLDTDTVEFDLSAAASAPSRSEDNDARRGMADLAPTLELGPNLNWTLARDAAPLPRWSVQLRAPVRAVLTLQRDARWIGWIATPNLNLDLRTLGGWNLGLMAGPVFGSQRLHAYFYDVPDAQAMATRPAYRAHGGAAGAHAVLGLSRRDGPRWLGGFVKLDTVRGAVFADSPLVRQRSNWSAGVAVSWVLLQSAQAAVESAVP